MHAADKHLTFAADTVSNMIDRNLNEDLSIVNNWHT